MTTLEEYLDAPKLASLLPGDLQTSDGEPLETVWHSRQLSVLIDSLTYHWRDRLDGFIGGDMFLYFCDRQVFNKDFRGPDFFAVKGVEKDKDRRYYATWEEGGRFPDVIIELLSPSTAHIDRVVKKALYERTFNTKEYLIVDRETESFESYQKQNGHYETIPPEENGMVWSKELELYYGPWYGSYLMYGDCFYLRFFDVHGNLLPTFNEAAELRANQATSLADAQQARADALHARTREPQRDIEAEKLRVETEIKARLDAERELAQLRLELKRLKKNGSSSPN